jgi:hypothetical protein
MIAKFYSLNSGVLFLTATIAMMWKIIYYIQCGKMEDYTFYNNVLAPQHGELPKYGVTRKFIQISSFLGASYGLYQAWKKLCQPAIQSQKVEVSHSETEIRDFHKNVPRSEKARTTISTDFVSIMESNVAKIAVRNSDGSISLSNTWSLDSNLFLVTGHSIPVNEQFDISINYMKERSHLIAHERLSEKDVYRIPDRDFCILHVPSSQPRKSLKDYLPFGNNGQDKPCMGRNVKFVSTSHTYGCQLTNEPVVNTKTSKAGYMAVETYKPQNFEPAQGDCGSAIINPVVSVIAGFHMGYMRKQDKGAFQRIYRKDLELARKFFEKDNFVPHSTGELNKGNIELSLECENATHLTSQLDPSVNLPLDKHNLCVYGANPLAKFSARNHYRNHPYKSSVEAVFGPEKYSPPYKINSSHHKRKALTKLASPNQDFVKQDVIYAADDYLKPIMDFIDNMSFDEKAKYGRILSDQETLDGISGECLNGINNHTSVGFPYKGKKSKYLLMDEDDPNVPIMPRTLKPYNNTDMELEVDNLKSRYLNQRSGGCIFKASMKTNELLPNHKIKGRVFMGCNFPFFVSCSPVFRWYYPVDG